MNDSRLPAGEGADEAMNDAICLDGRLPVLCRPVPEYWREADLAAFNDSNLLLLDAMLLMDGQRAVDSDETACCHQDLVRLEAKVDLMMALMSRLLSRHEGRPPVAPVVLSSQALEWPGGLQHEAGTCCEVDLYLTALVPTPLTLTGRIERPGRLLLCGIGPAFQGALEKYLFRQHRRAVADARNNRQAVQGAGHADL